MEDCAYGVSVRLPCLAVGGWSWKQPPERPGSLAGLWGGMEMEG
jgi:hypothetical protein